MAFDIGYTNQRGITGLAHKEMLRKIVQCATGCGRAIPPTFSGTGSGELTITDTTLATVTEVWTITCTAAAADGGTFSVTGSVSGAQAPATVGTQYLNSFIGFKISDGQADFAVGDKFTIQTYASTLPAGQRWEVLLYDTSSAASHLLYLKGPGLSEDKEIFIGFRTYESITADYYNLTAAGFIGYIPGTAWSSQPGFVEKGIPAHNQYCSYWLSVDGQQVVLCLGVGSPVVYESGGAGLFLPYARPGQYGYPMFVAGMLNGAPATRYSDTSHSMAWKGSRANFVLRDTGGSWIQPVTWPWSNQFVGGATYQLRDTNDKYPVLAIQLYSGTANLWGQLDGIGYVSNFNNTVESVVQVGGAAVIDNPAWSSAQRVQQILDSGGVPWLCLQDVGRTSFNDYFALRIR